MLLGTGKVLGCTSSRWSTNLVTPGNAEGQWQCDCKAFWHSLCCAHVYFVRHVRGELDLDKVRVVLCPLQTLVWYGRAKAWVTNQGSVPIRRPVQDIYGCFALSNSRAKPFFFLGVGGNHVLRWCVRFPGLPLGCVDWATGMRGFAQEAEGWEETQH